MSPSSLVMGVPWVGCVLPGDKGEKERFNSTKYELYKVNDLPWGDVRLFVDCLGLSRIPVAAAVVVVVVVAVAV